MSILNLRNVKKRKTQKKIRKIFETDSLVVQADPQTHFAAEVDLEPLTLLLLHLTCWHHAWRNHLFYFDFEVGFKA